MAALLIYSALVSVGTVVSIVIGYYVEARTSASISLVVFLSMFFANLAVAWIATILILDGSLHDAQGRVGQRAAEAEGEALLEAGRRRRAA